MANVNIEKRRKLIERCSGILKLLQSEQRSFSTAEMRNFLELNSFSSSVSAGLVHNCLGHLINGGYVKCLQKNIKLDYGYANGYIALRQDEYVHIGGDVKDHKEFVPKIQLEDGPLARMMGYTNHVPTVEATRKVSTDDYHTQSTVSKTKHGVRSGLAYFQLAEYGL